MWKEGQGSPLIFGTTVANGNLEYQSYKYEIPLWHVGLEISVIPVKDL